MRLFSLLRHPVYDLIFLGFLLALLFGIGLGDRPYSAPSEARYIEIGREMAESGDFVTPRLNYVKYFEKPPLFYWVQAISTKFFGVGTFAARVPTMAFSILLCLLTYGLGHMLYGRLAGWLGALTLGVSLYMFALSRIVLVDVPVSFFLAATLTAFLHAAYAPEGRKRTLIIYAMYICAACAVLTKGLIGAVLPGGVVFLWLAFTKRWSLLREMRLVSGTILFLAVAAPWFILVSLRNPEFPQFFFIHEHFQRFLTREAGRYQPIWFFAAVLLAGLFPWIAFIWQAKKDALKGFWQNRSQDAKPLFLVLWIGFIFCFFSVSDSKLIPYILPVFPPLAAMLGRYFAAAWEKKPTPGFAVGLWVLILTLALMASIPSLLLGFLDADNKVAVALSQGGAELHTLSIACIIAAGLLLITYIQGTKQQTILMLFAVFAVVLQLGDQVAAHYDKDSMLTPAEIITKVHKPGDEVAMYQIYYQDMPVYLKQRITLADWKGELEFGSEHEDTSAWMMSSDAFWKRWMKDDHRMFLVMREDTFNRLIKGKTAESLHLYTINQTGRNLLFMNRIPAIEPRKEPKKP